ncbi:hypothetical protein [Mucilaginibacter sp. 44-25]|uniref:hypothetical protein n=1 Tax=Mucilaginibacter sp. 44-25 TaxID=1895794 RepID=UPI000965F57B|nr:hypothetical protein [Mucilaginibacter sp. 44-25]OJW12507.1 MAG: hypothetical protein BGO48_05275 [Mucilaginibacter sp. 44-25]
MSTLKKLIRRRSDVAKAMSHGDELKYNEVPGKENLVVVSFYENGEKQSVQLETFPDEQISFFASLKEQVESFSAMNPQERAKVEQKLFALE